MSLTCNESFNSRVAGYVLKFGKSSYYLVSDYKHYLLKVLEPMDFYNYQEISVSGKIHAIGLNTYEIEVQEICEDKKYDLAESW